MDSRSANFLDIMGQDEDSEPDFVMNAPTLSPMSASVFRERLIELADEYKRLLEQGGHGLRASDDSQNWEDELSGGTMAVVPIGPAASMGVGEIGPNTSKRSVSAMIPATSTSLESRKSKDKERDLLGQLSSVNRETSMGNMTFKTSHHALAERRMRSFFKGNLDGVFSKSTYGGTVPAGAYRSTTRSGQDSEDQGQYSKWGFGRKLCPTLDPNALPRMRFDFCLFFVCLHDVVVLPFMLAWDVGASSFHSMINLFCLAFWWSEMILNFFTGYYQSDMLVTDVKMIAKRYARRMFFVDFTVNVVDVIGEILEATLNEDQPVFNAARVWRIARIRRFGRLMLAMSRLLNKFRVFRHASASRTMLGLACRLIGVLLLLNHIVSCMWYGIARAIRSDTGFTWLDQHIITNTGNYRATEIDFQYLTALHWAFTQMTPGSISVEPHSSVERIYNVGCLIIGLLTSSVMISQLSAKMVRIQTINHDRLYQMEMLNRFLIERDVPRSLAQRVNTAAQAKLEADRPLTVEDLPALTMISSSLRNELNCALFSACLLRHTIFYSWCVGNEAVATDLSSAAAVDSRHAGDEVLLPFQEAVRVYFRTQGRLEYSRLVFEREEVDSMTGSESSSLADFTVKDTLTNQESILLEEDSWFSVISLWCDWRYVGRMRALTNVELVNLDVSKVLKVLTMFPRLVERSVAYARAFSLLVCHSQNSQYVDLDMPASKVLMAMPLERRLRITSTIVDTYRQKGITDFGWLLSRNHNSGSSNNFIATGGTHGRYMSRNRTGMTIQDLADELDKGKCVVSIGADGQILRTVLVCTLTVMRSNGDILIRMAKMVYGDAPDIQCVLPGGKQVTGESGDEAAIRLLQELPLTYTLLQVVGSSDEKQVSKSKLPGINNEYLKTNFRVTYIDKEGEETSERELFRIGLEAAGVPNDGSVEVPTLMSVLPSLETIDVFDPEDPDKYIVYAWVSQAQFELLVKNLHNEEFKTWLQEYVPHRLVEEMDV